MRATIARMWTVLGLLLAMSLVAPAAARAVKLDEVDLDGTPDLIVDQALLRQHWIVRVEDFDATACDVQEGSVAPGSRLLAAGAPPQSASPTGTVCRSRSR